MTFALDHSIVARIFQWLMGLGLFLFSVSYYFPLPTKALFFAGIILPGLAWLLLKPAALPKFLKPLAWIFLPLALMQLLNINEWKEIKIWLYLVGFLGCVAYLDRQNSLDLILTGFSYISLAILAYCLADWIIIHENTGEWIRYGNLFGRAIDPIDIAMIIAIGLLYIWLNKVEPRLQGASPFHLLLGITVLSSLILLISTVFQARTLLLAYTIFLFVYLYSRRLWLFGFFAVFAVFFLSYMIGLDHLLLNRGLSYRPQIWIDATSRVTDVCNILTGCGKDGYLFLNMYTHAHNLLMQILYEDGLLGLGLFGIFAYYLINKGIRSNTFLLVILALGAQMTNTGWLLVPPKSLWVYFWLPMAVLVIEISRDKLKEYWAARDKEPMVWQRMKC